jgi:hypothetical protein
MSRPKPAGVVGEAVAEWSLVRSGWEITGRQVNTASGHRADFSAINPAVGEEEWLVEVKVWGAGPSGRDTVKKAIADAYDLHEAGEERPFLLVLSHPQTGLLGAMIRRARRAGVINDVLVIGASQHPDGNGAP